MSTIKFGIFVTPIPIDGSRGNVFTAQIENYLMEIGGLYESVWVPDHLTSTVMQRFSVSVPDNVDFLEAYTTISYLSALFKQHLFGAIVTCNSFRNPSLLAKMGSTLNAFTGGRFVLGIGAGWNENEYRQYGYDFPSAAIRIRQLEEGLQIIKKLWTEDDVTFKGKYFKVENAYCNPKPDPIPPIMVGCSGEKLSMKVVVKYADWWNIPFPSVERYKHKVKVLNSHCRSMGRNPDELLKTQLQFVIMAETDEEAKKKAMKSLYYGWPVVIGSPETVKRKLREHIKIGVDYFMLGFSPFPDLNSALMFEEDIIPELKEYAESESR